jgi:hypothetical protein
MNWSRGFVVGGNDSFTLLNYHRKSEVELPTRQVNIVLSAIVGTVGLGEGSCWKNGEMQRRNSHQKQIENHDFSSLIEKKKTKRFVLANETRKQSFEIF